jgi:predicted nucleic acid-binding protein
MNDEAGLEFVDTNILVYAHDLSAGEKYECARSLLELLWESKTGCLSIQVLQEFYITTSVKIKIPLPSETAADLISALAEWRVHRPEVKDILRAIEIQHRHQISFWDAMVVCSASALGCDILWSDDLDNGQVYEGVRVVNPFLQ